MKDHLSWETVLWMRHCEVEQEFTEAAPKSPQFSTRLQGVTTHKIVLFLIIIIINLDSWLIRCFQNGPLRNLESS